MKTLQNWKMLSACLIASVTTVAHAAPAIEASRGELLYTTHCIACHSTNVHWRAQSVVTDWDTLSAEVRKWQETIGLGWNADDIAAVATYLNGLFYHLPPAKSKEIALKKSGG